MLTVKKIAEALGCTPPQEDFEIKKVVTDSRKAEEHCLFVAIEGERVDGHSFIPELAEKYEKIAFLGTKNPQKCVKKRAVRTVSPYIKPFCRHKRHRQNSI